MTSINELKDALKETLEANGVLNEMKAMMREAIFKTIESGNEPKVKLTNENLIINEWIRDYLSYNNYLHSNSVFISESGQPVEPPFDRAFISRELNVEEDQSSRKMPLLYSLVFGLKKQNYIPNNMNKQNNSNLDSNMNPMLMMSSNKGNIIQQQSQTQLPGAMNVTSSNMNNINMSKQNNMYSQSNQQPQPLVID